MAIGDDFSIAATGDIRHVSGTTRYTVLDFHRWLQDLADQAQASGNDLLDITSSTPSARATDNIITLNTPFNIDDDAAEYLYDGSIEQMVGGQAVRYSGLVVVGSLAGTTTLQVVQDKALYDGDTPFWGTGINADAANNILSRMLIKTKDAGVDIDGGRILVYAREWGHTFAEFSVTMGLGNNVAAIFTSTDLNNQTAVGTVAGWTTIDNVEGYQTIDLGNGQGPQPYYSQWDKDIYTINQLYERAKWLTRRGTAETLYGLDGELFRGITHEFPVGTYSGTFVQNEEISWGSGATAGTGVVLACSDMNGPAGTIWMQLTSGVAPANGATVSGTTGGAHSAVLTSSPTSRNLSPCYLGQSTGSAIIGAFGIGIEAGDLTTNDKLFDLTNTMRQPPNNQQFIVYGLVSGEDRVLVTNAQGNGIDFDQMILGTTLSGATETQVDVGVGNIPADTPMTGNLRIELDSGIYRLVPYTTHDGSRYFTIDSTSFVDPNDATAGNNVFLAYIDKLADSTQLSITLKYSSNRTMFVRVRDGGTAGDNEPIKTFETTSLFSTGGGSATASRIADV
jgi:hypothetical protein